MSTLAGVREQNFAKPVGRALVVGPRPPAGDLATLGRAGLQAEYVDDPYGAMAEICRRPLAYRALLLPLTMIFREELGLIAAVKKRYPHVTVYLSQTDGRQATLADAMRLGVDGLLAHDGLHATVAGGTGAVAVKSVGNGAGRETTGDEAELERARGPAAVPPATVGERSGVVWQRPAVQATTPPAGAGGAGQGPTAGEAEMPGIGEPVLTAEELRALLQDQPVQSERER